MINLALENKMGFIFGTKPGDHGYLFEYLQDTKIIDAVESYVVVEDKIIHRFQFINEVPLNAANQKLLVIVLEYEEIKGKRWM